MTLPEVLGLLVGQARGGLVEQDEPRAPDDGPRDLDEAALAGAERADRHVGVDVAQPDEVERGEHVVAARRAGAQARVLVRERDVRRDRQLLDRLLGLERAPQAPARAAVVRHREEVVAEGA